jgi:hypothetical protein
METEDEARNSGEDRGVFVDPAEGSAAVDFVLFASQLLHIELYLLLPFFLSFFLFSSFFMNHFCGCIHLLAILIANPITIRPSPRSPMMYI